MKTKSNPAIPSADLAKVPLIKRMVFATLDALAQNGGQMRAKDLLAYIADNYPLSDHDLSTTTSGNPRWVNAVRYYSIPLSHAGLLRRDKGTWYITPDGEKRVKQGVEAVNEAMKNGEARWKIVHNGSPDTDSEDNVTEDKGVNVVSTALMDIDSVQELGRRSLLDAVAALNPYEFQDIVAALFRGLGYHVPFVAPKGKDGGIDIIAHSDPLGAVGPTIKIQVKHTPDSLVPVGTVRQLAALLRTESDCGVVVTSGRFTNEAERFAREYHRRLRLINGDELIDLWTSAYPKLTEVDQQLLPLISVCFFARQLSTVEL